MTPALPLSPAAAFAAGVAAKATLVLLAAGAAAWLVSLRGGPASARHLAWTLGVCAALALPLLSATLPGWRTRLLTVRAGGPAPSTFAAEPVIVRPAQDAAAGTPDAVTPKAAAPIESNVRPEPAAPAASHGIAPGTLAIVLYLAGVLAVLGRMVIGRWSVARLAASAEPVREEEWTALLRDLAWQMDVRRPVRLLRSQEATMPMTWGIAKPTVLLPAESGAWPEERRRVVLLHELAHVARHDCLTQTLAMAACALYWFNPAAWLAARRLRVERELACDDRVLTAGAQPRDYASHLLEVARAFRPAALAGPVAVSMARPSQLEGRLLAVLDGVRNRSIPTRAGALVAAGVALAVVLPLAAIRPAAAQQEVPAGVTFGGPKPWKDTTKVKPPRSPDAYPDLDEAMRQGGTDINIPVRPGERLTLRLPAGVSARVLAWDRPSVHVRVDDRGLHVNAARGEGGPYVIVTGRRTMEHSPDPEVRIMAPRDFSVDAVADGGGLEIGALNGTFTGTVTRGGLAFRGTRGTVRMTARGGGAFISETHLDGRLEMDGGGALVDRNTGNLDITGAAAIAHGRPGGTLNVSVPSGERTYTVTPGGRVRADDSGDAEVACTRDACTIAAAPVRGQARTAVTTTTGGQIATTTASGRVTAVTAGPTTTVSVAGAPSRTSSRASTSVVTAPSGVTIETGDGTQIAATTDGGRTTTVTVGSEPSRTRTRNGTVVPATATTVRVEDDDGFAYATGDADERIASVRAMARNAPAAAAAQGLARFAFGDPDERVQRAAVDELEKLGTRAAEDQLERIARDHPRRSIRARAAAAMR